MKTVQVSVDGAKINEVTNLFFLYTFLWVNYAENKLEIKMLQYLKLATDYLTQDSKLTPIVFDKWLQLSMQENENIGHQYAT